jgi:putative membrane protein
MLLATATDVWRFRPHPEVWLLVCAVVGLYVYAIKVIGPKAVLPGEPVVTRRQLTWFVGAVVVLEIASDWPLHDIAEDYLYSFHMVQHMLLTYVMPPMFLFAIPSWLFRLIIGPPGSRVYKTVRTLCKPVVAGLTFTLITAGSHWSFIVDNSVRYAAMHYSVHLVFVTTALMMWMCVCGPIAEWRLPPPLQIVYLVLLSVLPPLPGAWLALAGTPLYSVYNHLPRMWDIGVLDDQRAAGLIMQLGGSFYLWVIITIIFFRWARDSGFGLPTPGPRRNTALRPPDEADETRSPVTHAADR